MNGLEDTEPELMGIYGVAYQGVPLYGQHLEQRRLGVYRISRPTNCVDKPNRAFDIVIDDAH